MDSFFTAMAPTGGVKRKAEEPKGKGKAAASKSSGKPGGNKKR